MKKSDIAMIILIASISAFIAFAIANSLSFFTPPSSGEKVKTISSYSSSVQEPDTAVFHTDALNPTVKTVIGTDSQAN